MQPVIDVVPEELQEPAKAAHAAPTMQMGHRPNGSENVTGSPSANPNTFNPPAIPMGSACVNIPVSGSTRSARIPPGCVGHAGPDRPPLDLPFVLFDQPPRW